MKKNHHIGPEVLRAMGQFRAGRGEDLRARRIKLGLSQFQLAHLARTKQASISRLESRLKFGPQSLVARIERVLSALETAR